MKRSNRKVPVSTVVMFTAALVLLCFSAVAGARAALNIFSDQYDAELKTLSINVALVDEEGTEISGDDGLTLPCDKDEEGNDKVIVGKTYPMSYFVKNTGGDEAIDEYVRVDVYKYWTDAEGEKDPSLDPKLIKLAFNSGDWIEDTKLGTDERTVLYYTKILAPGETTASSFLKSVTVDSDVSKYATLTESTDEEGYTVITTTYDFNGVSYKVEIQADGVQTHNAKDAIKSAWGGNVTVDDSGNITAVN